MFQASHFFTEWCFENASYFQGKSILELGSGLGLTGLAVVQNCKPSSYIFTDVHDSVLRILRENVNINLSNESPLSYNADSGKNDNDLVSRFICILFAMLRVGKVPGLMKNIVVKK